MIKVSVKIESLIALVAVLSTLAPQASSQRAAGNRSQPLSALAPERVGMSGSRLAKIDEAVLDAIERKQTPGAVVLVGRKGHVVYRKAFGDRAVAPLRDSISRP
jgi:CubicO group peptidase (beta-lactamase class C family)